MDLRGKAIRYISNRNTKQCAAPRKLAISIHDKAQRSYSCEKLIFEVLLRSPPEEDWRL